MSYVCNCVRRKAKRRTFRETNQTPIDLFSFYVLFSHFIPRDGTPRELFLSNVHPRARVCIIDEKPNGKFPGEHHVV